MRTNNSYIAFTILLMGIGGLSLFAIDTTLPEPTVAAGNTLPDPSCDFLQKELDSVLLEIDSILQETELQQQKNEALEQEIEALLQGIQLLELGIETLEQGMDFFDSQKTI